MVECHLRSGSTAASSGTSSISTDPLTPSSKRTRGMQLKLKHLRREKDGRLYVRRNGRSFRLTTAPTHPGFLTEYSAALAAIGEPSRPQNSGRGSLGWLCLE